MVSPRWSSTLYCSFSAADTLNRIERGRTRKMQNTPYTHPLTRPSTSASARQEAGFGATGDVTVLRVTSSARLSYSAESTSKLCELCLFKKDWFRKKDLLFQINAQKEFDSQFMQ